MRSHVASHDRSPEVRPTSSRVARCAGSVASTAVLAIATLVLGACGSDSPTTRGAGQSSTSNETTSTVPNVAPGPTASPSTTTQAPIATDTTAATAPDGQPGSTTSTATGTGPGAPAGSKSADGCVAQLVPSGATVTGSIVADVNGDGQSDTVKSYFKSPGGAARLHVVLGGGGGFDSAVTFDGSGGGATTVLGAVHLGGSSTPDDNSQQVFARVGNAASGATVQMFFYDRCTLQPVTMPNGKANAFTIGGSVQHADGLLCDGAVGGFVLAKRSATSSDGTHYTTTIDAFRYENGALRSFASRIVGALTLPVNQQEFSDFSRLKCDSVEL